MITISVIIPVYNVSAYIERCIHSVMSQTYTDFECILVDDCGTDDSIAKCERMIAEYDGSIRFRILHHDHNRGLSAARNTGTDAAKGDYILYVDSDDALTNDCIEKLMTPILHDGTIEMVMGNADRISDGFSLPGVPPKRFDCEELKGFEAVRHCFYDRLGICIYAWNKLISKKFLHRNGLTFMEGILWEDIVWMFYLMKYLSHLYIVKDITYLRYLRPNSISTGTDLSTRYYHYGLVYNELSSHFTPSESHREARFYVRWFCRDCIGCIPNDLFNKTVHNFKQELSFWHDPFECLLLFVTNVVSHIRIGRMVFQKMRKTYKQNESL